MNLKKNLLTILTLSINNSIFREKIVDDDLVLLSSHYFLN